MKSIANVLLMVASVILFGCHQYNEDDYPPFDYPRLPEKFTADIVNLYIYVETSLQNNKYETDIDVWYEVLYEGNSYNIIIAPGQLPGGFIEGIVQSDIENPFLKSTEELAFSKFTSDGRTGVETSDVDRFEIKALALTGIEPNDFKASLPTYSAKDIRLNFVPGESKIRLVESVLQSPSGTQESFANYYATETGSQYAVERINSVQFPRDTEAGLFIVEK